MSEPPSVSTSGQPSDQPQCFVICYNVSKKHNIGTLLRSCTAFGVKEVCLVGARHFSAFGDQGTADYVALRHFPTLEACCAHLRSAKGCRVLGVEIDDWALPVQAHPFAGNTAFMLGNEGQGLSDKQLRLCDGLVYIPQHGPGTASLNVTIAASIVLHHFAVWAGLPERRRAGAKFVVDQKPTRSRPRGVVPLTEAEAAQQAADAAESAAWLEGALAGGGGMDGLMEALQDAPLVGAGAVHGGAGGAGDPAAAPAAGGTAGGSTASSEQPRLECPG